MRAVDDRLSLHVSNGNHQRPGGMADRDQLEREPHVLKSGQPLRTGTAPAGDFGEIPLARVTAPLAPVGPGTVSLQLEADSSDGLGFSSREAVAAERPQLLLVRS